MSAITAAAALDPEVTRIIIQTHRDHARDIRATETWMRHNFKPKNKLPDFCPECGDVVESQPGGGIACTVCDYWFCY